MWYLNQCSIFFLAVRMALGAILIVAGIGKLLHPAKFVAGVVEYKILPQLFAIWYGRLLPFVELGTGLFLLLGIFTQMIALITTLMFLSFMMAVGINLKRKREMPCFCFGADATDKMGWHTLARIGTLLLFGAILAFNNLALPALWQLFDTTIFAYPMDLVPIVIVSSCLLLFLSLIDIAPWSIRAWTSPGISASRQEIRVIWRRVFETEQTPEVNS